MKIILGKEEKASRNSLKFKKIKKNLKKVEKKSLTSLSLNHGNDRTGHIKNLKTKKYAPANPHLIDVPQ
jgi:hypothetical protein